MPSDATELPLRRSARHPQRVASSTAPLTRRQLRDAARASIADVTNDEAHAAATVPAGPAATRSGRRATAADPAHSAIAADALDEAVPAAEAFVDASPHASTSDASTSEPVSAASIAGAHAAAEAPAAGPSLAESPEPDADPSDATADTDVPRADAEVEREADAFAEAARALNFTGATALPKARTTRTRRTAPRDAAATRTRARRWVTPVIASMSGAAVLGMLALGLTTPLGAIAEADGATLTVSAERAAASAAGEEEEIQAFVAADDAEVAELDRVDDYSTVKIADLAEAAGIRTANAFFVNDPTADIQYPFAVGTSMSYGYGMRSGRLHEGIDFTPGEGAPVQSIADGTVRVATESGGAYGVNVYIDHVIDGETITSHYAHMEYGSLRVQAGDKVEVGDVIGRTGNTGRSFGAHTHFELLRGGATFDPQPWLEKYAGTHYSDDE